MSYVLALDQGTTSSRAILFDRAGALCAVAQREFTQHFPQPGWVEHDPAEIWSSQAAVIRDAMATVGAHGSDVQAIGITNQRETTIVWDRATGAPIHHGIVWQDRRTADRCERLRADGLEEEFSRRTGLLLDPYFAGTKIAWILDHVDGARDRARRGELAFGTVDSWLIWNLTGGRTHATDASNACRTLLYDIHRCAWSEELAAHLDVPLELLPEVVDSSGVIAESSAGVGVDGVPIAGVVGDQQAATAGQVCFEPGMAKNTYGTGCFLLMNTGDQPQPSQNRLLTTIAWRREGRTTYALEGSVFIGGAVVQWLRDGLQVIDRSADVEALARSVPDNGGVYLVPAFTGLGAPHWDPYARGLIVGLTRGSSAAHVARAALEAIAYEVHDLAVAMAADAEAPITELRVDGGAAANDLLMQFQADLLQTPVVRPTILETTALGAAYMAGMATGFWPDVASIEANWAVDRRFEPERSPKDVEALVERWRDAVTRSRGWARPEDDRRGSA